jgi:hypothetical protein
MPKKDEQFISTDFVDPMISKGFGKVAAVRPLRPGHNSLDLSKPSLLKILKNYFPTEFVQPFHPKDQLVVKRAT